MAEKKNGTVVCGCRGSGEERCDAIVIGTPNFSFGPKTEIIYHLLQASITIIIWRG